MFQHLGKIANTFSSLGSKFNKTYETVGGHIKKAVGFVKHGAQKVKETARNLAGLHPFFDTVSNASDNVSEFADKVSETMNKTDEVKNRIERAIRNN